MKTRLKTTIKCINEASNLPLVRTSLTSNGEDVHIMWIMATHYGRGRHAEIEIYAVTESLSTTGVIYSSAIREGPDVVTATIGKHQSKLGLTSCGRCGTLRYRFTINKNGFCKHSIQLIRHICAALLITETDWITKIIIYAETEVWKGNGWRKFPLILLEEMGYI